MDSLFNIASLPLNEFNHPNITVVAAEPVKPVLVKFRPKISTSAPYTEVKFVEPADPGTFPYLLISYKANPMRPYISQILINEYRFWEIIYHTANRVCIYTPVVRTYPSRAQIEGFLTEQA